MTTIWETVSSIWPSALQILTRPTNFTKKWDVSVLKIRIWGFILLKIPMDIGCRSYRKDKSFLFRKQYTLFNNYYENRTARHNSSVQSCFFAYYKTLFLLYRYFIFFLEIIKHAVFNQSLSLKPSNHNPRGYPLFFCKFYNAMFRVIFTFSKVIEFFDID